MGINKIIFAGEVLIDLTNLTVTPDTLVEGTVAVNAMGELIAGTAKLGPSTATVILNGAPNEVITYAGAQSGTVTLDSGGAGALNTDNGLYVFTGGISGYQQTVEISGDTVVNVWPNATMVYWYGRKFYTPTAISWVHSGESNNDKAPTITDNGTYITVTQPGVSGTYCGTMKFDNVTTAGGIPTLISSGRKASTSDVRCYFTIAEDITKDLFPYIEAYRMGYQETDVKLGVVSAGTYDIAVEVRNATWTPGEVDVHAIYIAE